jgi:hypothetical protein
MVFIIFVIETKKAQVFVPVCNSILLKQNFELFLRYDLPRLLIDIVYICYFVNRL